MARIVGIDHLAVSVSDIARSRAFYDKLLKFLGFRLLDEYPTMVGWTTGKTRVWIAQADAEGRAQKHRKGNVGFHHYAFELRSRADVDALEAFLKREGFPIADPADEYYDDYYAVFFTDPDGLRFEGMKYGEKAAAVKRAKSRRRAGKRKRRRA
jgi:catechol 2,3-dioxygenase-like lactoylglutathione lyase family enzyme